MHLIVFLAVMQPELSQFGFKINELKTMRKTMMHMLDVSVMNTITLQISGVDLMKQRLVDTSFLRLMKQMTGKTRARDAMPEAGR
jgi:hypothetical protein